MRRTTLLAGAALAAAATLAGAIPAAAQAASAHHHHRSPAYQTLTIPDSVTKPATSTVDYTTIAPDMRALLHAAVPTLAPATVRTVADAVATPGRRLTLVATALSYLGTPYVLGGASHYGVDCSGLTMLAYQAIGVSLAHYVPTQDAAGAVIPQAEARPGDLVVFNDEDHVALYLGAGEIVAAPSPGRAVQIQQLSHWAGVAHHFTRLIQD